MKKRTKIIIAAIAAAVMLACGGGLAAAKLTLPYELTAGGETLVCVKDQATGEKVIKKLLESYVPDDSEFESITLDKDLKLKQVEVTEAFSDRTVMTGKEALDYLKEANGEEGALFTATVQSRKVKEETYTPDVEYREDGEMFAGESRVEREGSDGVRKVTYQVTSVNGKLEEEKEVDSEVVEEGESRIVYKGTLGVPDGEDWKTYEGSPVFNDGNDIVVSAKQHLGSPYKYNGRSFTTGIDCVHYVKAIYRMYGIEVPSKHSKIRKFGTGVSYKNAKPGDIICYKHHVAIYVGNGKMAEATPKHGTHIGKVRKKGIITVRRVHKN